MNTDNQYDNDNAKKQIAFFSYGTNIFFMSFQLDYPSTWFKIKGIIGCANFGMLLNDMKSQAVLPIKAEIPPSGPISAKHGCVTECKSDPLITPTT